MFAFIKDCLRMQGDLEVFAKNSGFPDSDDNGFVLRLAFGARAGRLRNRSREGARATAAECELEQEQIFKTPQLGAV